MNFIRDRFIDMVEPVNRLDPLNRGLVAWWLPLPGLTGGSKLMNVCRLGDKDGYHGTLTNMDPASDWVDSFGIYQGLDFDGSNDSVDGTITLTHPFTICAWLKTRDTTYTEVLEFNNGTNYAAFDIVTDDLRFSLLGSGGRNVSWDNSLTTDWVFATGIANADGSCTLYINGNLIGTSATTTTFSVSNFYLGRNPIKTTAKTFDGVLGSISVYNRGLSEWEIGRLFRNAYLQYPTQLNRWYPRRRGIVTAGGFQSAWARGSNQIIQPLVSA